MTLPNDHPERRETDWMFQRLNDLETQMREQHQRLRSDMAAGFMQIGHQINDRVAPLERRAEDHSGRIIVIETERRGEAKDAVKRGTWAGMLAGIGATGVFKVLDHFFK